MEYKYYVYILIDPRNNQPFYVGKGIGNRMFNHRYDALSCNKAGKFINNKPHHELIREILNAGMNIVYQKVLFNVSENVAYKYEADLIGQYGRKSNDTGILLNIGAGGKGGKSEGKPVSQYSLDRILIQDFSSAKQASECIECANASYIAQCCKGRRVSAGGFLWAYKGQQPKPMNKEYWQAVCQYSLTGQLLNTFSNLTEAEKATNIGLRNISSCCRGKSSTAGSFIWAYKDEVPKLDLNKTKYTKVCQFKFDGEQIATYDCARQVKTQLGLVSQNITKCCQGLISSVGGFLWAYEGETPDTNIYNGTYTVVQQWTVDEVLLNVFKKIRDAAKAIGISSGSISNCINGRSKTAGGYAWKYA